MTLLSGNIFNTDNLAVPIPIVDPTDIFGTVETNTSVTIPAAVIAGVSNINFVFSEDTPITCSPFNFAINVDIPEILGHAQFEEIALLLAFCVFPNILVPFRSQSIVSYNANSSATAATGRKGPKAPLIRYRQNPYSQLL